MLEPSTQQEIITLVKHAESLAKLIDLEIEKDMKEVEQLLLREATIYLFQNGGKRLRPFLVLTCAEAISGTVQNGIPPALAIEYLHNLSLIHDDMMDNSPMRHGRPTLHSKFGNSTALLVGDLLYAKAVEQASRVPHDAIRMVDILAKTAKQMCFGQFDDMSFETRTELEISDYILMATRKTSALYKASCVCGILAGQGSEEQITALSIFGEKIGTAFQIWDDVLDLQADPLRLGKPLGLDICAGKKTLVVIHFLKQADEKSRNLFMNLLGKENSNEKLEEVIELLKKTDSINFAKNIALKFLEESKLQLDVLPHNRARTMLYNYADFLLQRGY